MCSQPSKTSKENSLHLYSIGLKLKTLRAEKRLTLARLGAETHLSTALLSKLESDKMVPTLPTLSRICRVYGVDLSYFFSAVQHHSLAITRKAHMAHDGREQPIVKLTPLHVPTAQSKQVSKVIHIPAGVTTNLGESGNKTELTAYVLEGILRLSVAGAEEVLLSGDCVVLDTDCVVLWGAGDSGCRVLSVSVH